MRSVPDDALYLLWLYRRNKFAFSAKAMNFYSYVRSNDYTVFDEAQNSRICILFVYLYIVLFYKNNFIAMTSSCIETIIVWIHPWPTKTVAMAMIPLEKHFMIRMPLCGLIQTRFRFIRLEKIYTIIREFCITVAAWLRYARGWSTKVWRSSFRIHEHPHTFLLRNGETIEYRRQFYFTVHSAAAPVNLCDMPAPVRSDPYPQLYQQRYFYTLKIYELTLPPTTTR